MKFTRREFVSVAGLGAVFAGYRSFATPSAGPLFKIGFLTDTHVRDTAASCELVRGAMKVFRGNGCNAVVHCGDLADYHFKEGYKHYRAAVEAAFPPDMANRPEFLYVHANHDIIDPEKAKDPKLFPYRYMDLDESFRSMDMLIQGAVQPHFVSRTYHGIPVLVFPQEMKLIGGYQGLEAKIAAACAEHSGKPVVVCLHVPPADTTYDSNQWGYPVVRKILDKFPQVVCFSGHTHNTLRNERCIWNGGGFTNVDVGCLQYWHGMTIGTPQKSKRAYEVIVAEFYADNSIVVRRFDVRDGTELRPESPWTVPIRRAPEVPGAFPAGAMAECVVDAVPFSSVRVRFPSVSNADDVLHYQVEAARRAAVGWETCARADVYGEFYLRPQDRTGTLESVFSAGFFDGGEYRISVTPVGFFGAMGRPLEVLWTVPEKAAARTVWSCARPMDELKFRCGSTYDARSAANTKEVAVKDGWVTRKTATWAVLPEGMWNIPKGSKLRFIADIRMEQGPSSKGWTLNLRATDGTQRSPCGWINAAPEQKGVVREVFEFTLRQPGVPYHFTVAQGGPGRFRIESLKLEEVK